MSSQGGPDLVTGHSPTAVETVAYPWSPLDPSLDQIRLLDLFPANFGEPLRGTLRTVSLSTKPSYEALSYTWSSPTDREDITINEQWFCPTRANLYRALQRLRKTTVKRCLWVDAVCINQLDIAERSAQVAYMGRIFSEASRVLVWLGDYPGTLPADLGRALFFDSAMQRSDQPLQQRRDRLKHALQTALRSTDHLWYRRAWPVQEFILAAEIRLCFGNVSTKLEGRFFEPAFFRDADGWEVGDLLDWLIVMERCRLMRDSVNWSLVNRAKWSLIDLARWTKSTEASDPRDKVFSLVSLIKTEEAQLITPDYSTAWPEVFARATYASIKASGSFAILAMVTGRKRGNDMPSFAVDFTRMEPVSHCWSTVREAVDCLSLGMGNDDSLLSAALGQISVNERYRELSISCVLLDQVAGCVRVQNPVRDDVNDPRLWSLDPFLCKLAAVIDDLRTGKQAALATQSHKLRLLRYNLLRSPQDVQAFNALAKRGWRDRNHAIAASFALWDQMFLSSTLLSVVNDARGPGNMRIVEFLCRFESYCQSYMPNSKDYRSKGNDHPSVFTTHTGYIGITTGLVMPDDILAVVGPSPIQLVLRWTPQGYKFRGLGYVHSIFRIAPLEQLVSNTGVERVTLC